MCCKDAGERINIGRVTPLVDSVFLSVYVWGEFIKENGAEVPTIVYFSIFADFLICLILLCK